MDTINTNTETETMSTTTNSTATEIQNVIDEHERHQGAYFWRSNGSASHRRRAEFDLSYEWTVDGKHIEVRQYHKESCRNVYYGMTVTVDGVKKNVRALKSALAKLKGGK